MFAIGLTAASATSLFAKPDFSQSTVTATPAAVVEGDVVTFSVRVRNSGDQDAPHTEIDLELPLEGMFVDLTGFPGATIDRAAKLVKGAADLPAGAAFEFQFRVVAPRDSGGHVLTPDLRIRNLYLGAEYYGGAEVVIDTRSRHDGVVLGGIRITPAGLVALAVLALLPILAALFWRRTRSWRPLAAIVIALGFWTVFAAMAFRDWRSLREWKEISCTILDSRLRQQTSSQTTVAHDLNGRARRDDTTYKPLLALQYTVEGSPMISTGFDTGSRLSVGGSAGAIAEFDRWPPGTTVPCWFDPAAPEDVVVIRGFGGAYFFALLPIPVFLYGAAAILYARPRRR
jgi:hypothetical protein